MICLFQRAWTMPMRRGAPEKGEGGLVGCDGRDGRDGRGGWGEGTVVGAGFARAFDCCGGHFVVF